MNLSSGHVNFSDEVTSAVRLSDGIVLFIDAAEGVSSHIQSTANVRLLAPGLFIMLSPQYTVYVNHCLNILFFVILNYICQIKLAMLCKYKHLNVFR